jgi:hypothetical protein
MATRAETPLVPPDEKQEIFLLVDTSNFMRLHAAEGSTVTRWGLLSEAMPTLITALEDLQSDQAQRGVQALGFSQSPQDIGKLTRSSISRQWEEIDLGGSRPNLMAAVTQAQRQYLENHGEQDVYERPSALAIILAGGPPADAAEFTSILEQAGSPGTEQEKLYAVIAVLGYGEEHDQAIRAFEQVETANPKHVRVVSFEGETNPQRITDQLSSIAGAQTR